MKNQNVKYLIRSDVFRREGKYSFRLFLKNLLLNPSFRVIFFFRLSYNLYKKNSFLLFLPRFFLRHYGIKYGISLSHRTEIGKGFVIEHHGGIVISSDAVIGDNCTMLHGVTLGITKRGGRSGVPVLGDNVYVGAGAKIIGGVSVGNNSAIGANAVVVKDVPDNAVVVGIPAKVISSNGSADYILNTGY